MDKDDYPTPTPGAVEAELIAWFHSDAAHAHGELSKRSQRVAEFVGYFGLDACEKERRTLRDLEALTCKLLKLPYCDLNEDEGT